MLRRIPIPLETRYHEFTDCWKRGVKKPSRGAVHDFRTACRRLLASLELAQGLIRIPQIVDLQARIDKALKAVGDLRDVQVQQRAVAEFDDPDRFEDFQQYLRKIEKREAKHIEHKLTDRRRKKIRNSVRDVARILEETVGRMDPVLVRKTLEKDVRKEENVIARRSKNGFRQVDAASLHHLRIRIKGLRYMFEIVQPQQSIDPLRELQQRMGELHDLSELEIRVSQWARDEGIRGTEIVKALNSEIRIRRSHGLHRLKPA